MEIVPPPNSGGPRALERGLRRISPGCPHRSAHNSFSRKKTGKLLGGLSGEKMEASILSSVAFWQRGRPLPLLPTRLKSLCADDCENEWGGGISAGTAHNSGWPESRGGGTPMASSAISGGEGRRGQAFKAQACIGGRGDCRAGLDEGGLDLTLENRFPPPRRRHLRGRGI